MNMLKNKNIKALVGGIFIFLAFEKVYLNIEYWRKRDTSVTQSIVLQNRKVVIFVYLSRKSINFIS